MVDKLINQLDTELNYASLSVSDLVALRDVSGNVTVKVQIQYIVKRGLNGADLNDLGNVDDSATPADGSLLIGDGTAWQPITLAELLAALLPSYTGNAGEVLAVNVTEDGVVWSTGVAGGGAQLDEVQVWTAAQRSEVTTLTYASTIAVDLSLSNFFTVTMTGNAILGNPTNQVSGQSGAIWFIQDGTGSRTLSLSGNYKTVGGVAIELSTSAGAVDRLDYVVRANGFVEVALSKGLA
jgi:hypothetical protein